MEGLGNTAELWNKTKTTRPRQILLCCNPQPWATMSLWCCLFKTLYSPVQSPRGYRCMSSLFSGHFFKKWKTPDWFNQHHCQWLSPLDHFIWRPQLNLCGAQPVLCLPSHEEVSGEVPTDKPFRAMLLSPKKSGMATIFSNIKTYKILLDTPRK